MYKSVIIFPSIYRNGLENVRKTMLVDTISKHSVIPGPVASHSATRIPIPGVPIIPSLECGWHL